MKPTVWFPYEPVPKGRMPKVNARLRLDKKYSITTSYLVDTGALISLVPSWVGNDFVPLDKSLERDTGCLDVHGRAIYGIPYEVEILINGLEPVAERIWFNRDSRFSLLGQTFLQKLGARFENFETQHRQPSFAFYEPLGRVA